METIKKEKRFDAVVMMRQIREKISLETENMTFLQLKKYIKNKLLEKEGNKSAKTYSIDKIREDYQQAYQPWSKEDDKKLEQLVREEKKIAELSKIFRRNEGAIRSRIKKLGLREKYGR